MISKVESATESAESVTRSDSGGASTKRSDHFAPVSAAPVMVEKKRRASSCCMGILVAVAGILGFVVVAHLQHQGRVDWPLSEGRREHPEHLLRLGSTSQFLSVLDRMRNATWEIPFRDYGGLWSATTAATAAAGLSVLPDQGGLVHDIVGRGEPVVIRQFPGISGSPGVTRWGDGAYLRRRVGEMAAVKSVIVSPVRYLVYAEDDGRWKGARPSGEPGMSGGVPGFEKVAVPSHDRATMAPAEFWQHVDDHSDGKFAYFVANQNKGNLDPWITEDLAPLAEGFRFRPSILTGTGSPASGEDNPSTFERKNDNELSPPPLTHFCVSESPFYPILADPPVNMQVWLGEAGLISLLHYDSSHNFFLQLYGRKTFVLLPPSEAPKVQLFPWAHPGDAHTQLPLEDHPAMEALLSSGWGDLHTLNASVAHLRPGDVLYIPPYWLHHVITWDIWPSASVSFITQSEAQRVMLDVERVPVPVMESWTRPTKRRMAALMASLVWTQMERGLRDPQGSLEGSLGELLQARYRVWVGDPRSGQKKAAFKCEFLTGEEDLQNKVRDLASTVATHFLRVRDAGTRKLLFWNYIEALAVVVSEGTPKEIPRWIQDASEAGC